MFKLDVLLLSFVEILTVVPQTLFMAFIILIIATFFGGIITIIEQYKLPVISQIVKLFKSFLRGTPAVVLLYIMYYALPEISQFLLMLIGVDFNPHSLSPIFTAIVTFSLALSAFQSEIIRGAFLSVNYGQIEAAQSLGYSYLQTFWRIIVPQALAEAIPDFLNSYMVIIKILSLAFLITVVDIFAQAKIMGAMTFRYLEAFVAAAIIYWVLSVIMMALINRYELRLRKGH